jgi:G3E family GTPase
VADHPEQFVVQGVHMMFDGCRGRLWRPEEARKSVLVFIGVELDEFQLQQEFADCTVKSLEKAKQKK